MKTPVWTHPPLEQWTQGGPVQTTIDEVQIAALESASEARTGSASAMGLFGFALGTTLIGWVLVGWAPMPASLVATIPALLIFAGIGQFIAGLFAFARTNTWAGTAMCSYGANNVIVAAYLWMQGTGMIPRTPGNMLVLAIDLFCMGYISLALFLGALRINVTYALIALALAVGYTLPGIQFLGGSRGTGIVGGAFLLAAAALAFYAATAIVVNSAWRQQALPLFNLNHHRSTEP